MSDESDEMDMRVTRVYAFGVSRTHAGHLSERTAFLEGRPAAKGPEYERLDVSQPNTVCKHCGKAFSLESFLTHSCEEQT